MKIKDLMNDIFTQDMLNGNGDLTLYPKDLEKIKDQIIKLDEFKDVSELVVLEIPYVEDMEGNPVESISVNLDDSVKFSDKLYIYSISLSPEIFDTSKLNQLVKDGASLSPLIYDPITYTPTRRITMEFSVEKESFKILHDTLDDIFKNPNDYKIKGDRSVIVRFIRQGISENNVPGIDVVAKELNINPETQKNFYIYYMKNNILEDNSMSVSIDKKRMPIEYKNKFKEKFVAKVPTEEEMNDFLVEINYKD